MAFFASIGEFFVMLTQSFWGITLLVVASCAIWITANILLYRVFFKRFYDIILSLIAMPFVLLIMIPVAIAIKCEDKGKVFYCGYRLGRKCKPFRMIKFRSMKENAPDIRLKDGSTYNGEDDPRVTKVGKFLRDTSLDEIPQVINILLGQMSIIGARPDTVDCLEKYSEDEKKYLDVRPGITGYNQAYFRNSISTKQKLYNDMDYAKGITLWWDIKIFFKTIATVFKKENVYNSFDESGLEPALENTETPIPTEKPGEASLEAKENEEILPGTEEPRDNK